MDGGREGRAVVAARCAVDSPAPEPRSLPLNGDEPSNGRGTVAVASYRSPPARSPRATVPPGVRTSPNGAVTVTVSGGNGTRRPDRWSTVTCTWKSPEVRLGSVGRAATG